MGTPLEEPICRGDLPASMHTLDHLAGIRHRHLLPHFPEMGLREALQTLTDRTPVSVDLMATRIARSLAKVREFVSFQNRHATLIFQHMSLHSREVKVHSLVYQISLLILSCINSEDTDITHLSLSPLFSISARTTSPFKLSLN